MKNKIINPIGGGSASAIMYNLSQCYTGKDVAQQAPVESKSPISVSPFVSGLKK